MKEKIIMPKELADAYHKLYDLYWNHTATVDISRCHPGYNGIKYDEETALDDAAAAIETLLVQEAGSEETSSSYM